jgi:hypothetical protein
VWDLCTPGFFSETVSRYCTLTPAAVSALAHQAQAAGLGVQLRPLIRVGPPSGWSNPHLSWEGHINPPNQRTWFASLLHAQKPYLKILRSIPDSEFILGTELNHLARSPVWPSYIRQARAACDCRVSVAAFHENFSQGIIPPVANPGLDWYPPFSLAASAPQRAVTRAWEVSLAPFPRFLLARMSLDEVSIRATAGAYHNPPNWALGGAPAPQVQARYFTAACRTAEHFHMRAVWFYEIPLNDDPANPDPFPAFFVHNAGAQAIHDCAGGDR